MTTPTTTIVLTEPIPDGSLLLIGDEWFTTVHRGSKGRALNENFPLIQWVTAEEATEQMLRGQAFGL